MTISLKDMTKGDTCFYKIKTLCGVLSTSVELDKKKKSGKIDNVNINFIEFSDKAVMIGNKYIDSNMGGAPGKEMPMRAESFYYK